MLIHQQLKKLRRWVIFRKTGRAETFTKEFEDRIAKAKQKINDVIPDGATFTIFEMFQKMHQLLEMQAYQVVEHSIKSWK